MKPGEASVYTGICFSILAALPFPVTHRSSYIPVLALSPLQQRCHPSAAPLVLLDTPQLSYACWTPIHLSSPFSFTFPSSFLPEQIPSPPCLPCLLTSPTPGSIGPPLLYPCFPQPTPWDWSPRVYHPAYFTCASWAQAVSSQLFFMVSPRPASGLQYWSLRECLHFILARNFALYL